MPRDFEDHCWKDVITDDLRIRAALPTINADFGTTAQSDWENGTEGDDFDGIRESPSLSGAARDDEDGTASERDHSDQTLAEHLQLQLAGMRLSDADRAAIQVLIDSLDEDGLLKDQLEDIARSLMGLPLVVAYAAAKSAYRGVVSTLATEWGPQGVRVNAIAPGWISSAPSSVRRWPSSRERPSACRRATKRERSPLCAPTPDAT